MSKAAGATMNAMIISKIGPLVDPMHGPVLYHIGSLTGEALVNNKGKLYIPSEFSRTTKRRGQNPKVLASSMDTSGLVNSLTGNLQRFGLRQLPKSRLYTRSSTGWAKILGQPTIPSQDENGFQLCHADRVATKVKRKTRRPRQMSTDWSIGQPLAFPPKRSPTVISRLARVAVKEAIRGPSKLKQQKRKKK
jgi:hypothetical protein